LIQPFFVKKAKIKHEVESAWISSSMVENIDYILVDYNLVKVCGF
jgi:hypothetical protein